jgi:hypothetical protein
VIVDTIDDKFAIFNSIHFVHKKGSPKKVIKQNMAFLALSGFSFSESFLPSPG